MWIGRLKVLTASIATFTMPACEHLKMIHKRSVSVTVRYSRGEYNKPLAYDIDRGIPLIHNMLHIQQNAISVSKSRDTGQHATIRTSSATQPPFPAFSPGSHLTPPNIPPSYSVTRGISPLTHTAPPATTCPSPLLSTRAPKASISSNVGSGASRPMTFPVPGGMIPRATGRSGCRSTTQGGAEDGEEEDAAAALRRRRKERMPPLWSECQCERTMRSTRSGRTLSAATLRAMLRDSGPVSKRVVCVSVEPSACVS